MSIDYREIGKRIRLIRKAQNLSQEQLAEKIDVGTSHISHIENGHTKMSIQVLILLSNALNVSADQLLCGHIYEAKEVLHDEFARILSDCSNQELNILSDILKAAKNAVRNHN